MSQLPKGWAEATVGDLVTLNYGKSLPSANRENGPYNVYGSNGIVGIHIESITKAPAIILGRKGSIGEVHYSETQCFPIDTTYFIDDFYGNNPRFLSYLLKTLPLTEMNRATAIPGLNRNDVYSLKIGLPPYAEQKRIVTKIESLTSRTALARSDLGRIPKLLEKYKEVILKLIFDNVTGQETTIQELTDFVTSGSRGWAKYYKKEGPFFLRIGNTKRGSIDLDLSDKQSVAPPKGAEAIRTRVKNGDILVTITADLGRVAVIPNDFGEAYINQHIALIRLSSPEIARYVAWFLASPEGQARLHENNRGVTRAGLGLNDIRNLRLTLPEPETQEETIRRIETTFDWLDKVATNQVNAMNLLSKLDAIILSKAFQGKLTPQYPSEESASTLLTRIRTERNVNMEKNRQIHLKDKQMIKTPTELLLKDSESWPKNGLPFAEVAKRNAIPYETIRDAIFSLLAEKKPRLQQVFDNETKCMYLQRVEI